MGRRQPESWTAWTPDEGWSCTPATLDPGNGPRKDRDQNVGCGGGGGWGKEGSFWETL